MYDTNSLFNLGHRKLVYPSYDNCSSGYKTRNDMKYLHHTPRSSRIDSNFIQPLSKDPVKVYRRRSYLYDNNNYNSSPRTFLNHNSSTPIKPTLVYMQNYNMLGSQNRLNNPQCSPKFYKRLSNGVSRENLTEKYKGDHQKIVPKSPLYLSQHNGASLNSKQANDHEYSHRMYKQPNHISGSKLSPPTNGYKNLSGSKLLEATEISPEASQSIIEAEKDGGENVQKTALGDPAQPLKICPIDETRLPNHAKELSPKIHKEDCKPSLNENSKSLPNGKTESVEENVLQANPSKSYGNYNSMHGISPQVALALYRSQLTQHECREIEEYPEIYFLGLNAIKRYPAGTTVNEVLYDPAFNNGTNNVKTASSLIGFDDSQSGYIISLNDHIAYRYEILKVLGKGSFGQVIHAFDHRNGQQVAVKIIRKEARFTRQSVEELRILKILNEQQNQKDYNVVKLLHHFVFRGHVCMVFELLNINLFELIHRNRFRGLSQKLSRKLITSILTCLDLLYRNNVIHCDLKPENILLRSSGKVPIKVIDFGSSCFVHNQTFNYIQSRFYRAPEVILGLPYNTPIDMWSLGCVLAELITGVPLFPGEDEADQLAAIMEVLGVPPLKMIQSARRSHLFFTSTGEPLYVVEQQKHDQPKPQPNHEQQQQQQQQKQNVKTDPADSSNHINGDSDDLNPTASVQSVNAAGKSRSKSRPKSKYWKQRQPPGSKDLVTVLTGTGNSSVYLPSTHSTNGFSRMISSGDKLPQPIDLDMVDFIKRCLEWLPENRMTPAQALQHIWILKKQTPNTKTYDNQDEHEPEQNQSRNPSIYLSVEEPSILSSPKQQQQEQPQQNPVDGTSLYRIPVRNDNPSSSLANLLGVRLRRHPARTTDGENSSRLSTISIEDKTSNCNYRRYSSDQDHPHYFPRHSDLRRSSRLSFVRSSSKLTQQQQQQQPQGLSVRNIELQQYRPFLRDSVAASQDDTNSVNSNLPTRNLAFRSNVIRPYKCPSYYDGLNVYGRIRVDDNRFRFSSEITDPTI